MKPREIIFALTLYPVCIIVLLAFIASFVYPPLGELAFNAFVRYEAWAD